MSDHGVQQRIGDAERDRATECLRDHMASGRLDPAEFDERLEKALTAHYQSDLDQLFVDLPAPRPEPAARATPPPMTQPAVTPVASPAQADACTRSPAGWSVLVGLAWAAAIGVAAISGWHIWWLIFIPLVLSGGFGRHHHQRLQRQQLRRQQLQLHRMNTRVRSMR